MPIRVLNKIFKNKYFGPELDVQVQFFNLLVFIGIGAGIFIALIALIIKEHPWTIVIDLIISVMSYALLKISDKKKCYHLCSWLIVIFIFIITFPALFVVCGGYRSGMSCFFVLAIIFTAHILENFERVAAVIVEFLLYIACCLIAIYWPETALFSLPEHIYIIDVALNFTVSGVLLLFTVMLRNRMINIKQEQLEELNRELIARNETLAQYDNMKSDFLATVAHEINTPLAVISASSSDTLDLLKETPLNICEITENQHIIERRVKLIDSILLDLMDTVAIENGRLSLSRQPVGLSEFIKNLCVAQHKKLDVNSNEVEFELQEGLPLIWLDLSRIEQVFTNLLSNAFRHTNRGKITVKLIRMGGSQVVSVADNGEGMDAETSRTILKQYVSTKADYWRHGIGLIICRRIITAHGGEIWIESEKGRGTTVFFSLREEPDYE